MPELAPELVEEDDGTTKSVAPQWMLTGEPDLLPLDGVFFANSATKPSVKVLMAAVSVVQLEVDDAWLPAVTAEENCWKKLMLPGAERSLGACKSDGGSMGT